MPVVTAILSSTSAPAADVTERFTAQVAAHCQAIMRAAPDKVQVQMLQAVAPLHGAPIYLEIQYRHQDFRDGTLLDTFMVALEATCLELFQLKPRIRCFPQRNDQLYARN